MSASSSVTSFDRENARSCQSGMTFVRAPSTALTSFEGADEKTVADDVQTREDGEGMGMSSHDRTTNGTHLKGNHLMEQNLYVHTNLIKQDEENDARKDLEHIRNSSPDNAQDLNSDGTGTGNSHAKGGAGHSSAPPKLSKQEIRAKKHWEEGEIRKIGNDKRTNLWLTSLDVSEMINSEVASDRNDEADTDQGRYAELESMPEFPRDYPIDEALLDRDTAALVSAFSAWLVWSELKLIVFREPARNGGTLTRRFATAEASVKTLLS